MSTVYTIGHSAHSYEEFAKLARRPRIEVVVDTRSAPYSRYAFRSSTAKFFRRSLAGCGHQVSLSRERVGRTPKEPGILRRPRAACSTAA